MSGAVLDTNVLNAGQRSRLGASLAMLVQFADGKFRGLATTALFMEYGAVAKWPERREALGFSEDSVDQLLSESAVLLEPEDVRFTWRPQLPGPAGELVLEAAVNGRADALVTHNVRNFAATAPRFGVPVLRPAEFLRGAAS